MEWDTNQVAHTFKTQFKFNIRASLLDILETGITCYETDKIILKMKKVEPTFL